MDTSHSSQRQSRTSLQGLRKAALHTIGLLIPLILVLGVTEVILRIWDPIGLDHFAEAKRYFSLMQPNPQYAYIHPPGLCMKLQGAAVEINSLGFRGPELTVENGERKTRIMVLGDSLVFGWGVPQEAIFPIRLQRMINLERPDVEVIPAGVGSWNSRTEFEYLKCAGLQLQPQAILLMIVHNDLEPHIEGHTEVPKEQLVAAQSSGIQDGAPIGIVPRMGRRVWRAAVNHSQLFSYAQYYRKRSAVAAEQSEVNTDSPSWQDARLALDGIIQLCRENGILLLPYLYGSATTIEGSDVLKLYRSYLEKQHLPVFTMPEHLMLSKRMQNSIVDGHPNSEGHEIIAQKVYQDLRPVLDTLGSRAAASAQQTRRF